MHRCLCDLHFARLPGQKEINVVGLPVRPFHVYASEVFTAAEIGQPIVVYSYQIETKILASVFDVKLAVTALFALSINVFLDTSGNISRAHLFLGATSLRVFRAFLWVL